MRYAALALLFLLAGCGSPRTDFYTLTAVPPAGAPASAGACGTAPVMVNRVLIPGVLDRQSMVRDGGGGELDISNQDRWAGPLDQMIQRVLSEDLRDRLPPGSVLAPGDPTPAGGALGVSVNVLRFMPEQDDRVTLRADWTLFDIAGKPMLTRSVLLSVPARSDRGTAVSAMSGELGELANRIVAALGRCGTADAHLGRQGVGRT